MKKKKFGLIGNPLSHSISPKIHKMFMPEIDYRLYPLEQQEFNNFLATCDLDGFNVTVPYKQKIMEQLDRLDQSAQMVQAVNTVVKEEGQWVGYNTDYLGFMKALEFHHMNLKNETCAILGSGGACKGVCYALDLLDVSYTVVSRTPVNNQISYQELKQKQQEFTCLIQTTPVGMDPNLQDQVLKLDGFTNLNYVIDIIANPLRTKFLLDAKSMGCQTMGGFDMLVMQAAAADELFFQTEISAEWIQQNRQKLFLDEVNLVLIGMPSCGKSTVGKDLAKQMNFSFVDMDNLIEEKLQMPISSYLTQDNEEEFRKIEQEVAESLQRNHHTVISCGGGVVENNTTMQYLMNNGIVIYLDKDLEKLQADPSRPLSNDRKKLESLYERRKDLYLHYADYQIKMQETTDENVNMIRSILKG